MEDLRVLMGDFDNCVGQSEICKIVLDSKLLLANSVAHVKFDSVIDERLSTDEKERDWTKGVLSC
mgnify:FL=1